MHIPDGFLDTKTWATLALVSGVSLGFAINKVKKDLNEKKLPLMGVIAAFIFAAQMLNFPISGGTSGHFVGGVFAAIILGPASGLLIMSLVLLVQCFIFQDGGVTALGANIFNMGIITSVFGYYLYKWMNKILKKDYSAISVFLASWVSIVLAAVICSFELAISGTTPLKVVLPVMGGFHMLIGIGEGLITVFVMEIIRKAKPEILFHLKGE